MAAHVLRRDRSCPPSHRKRSVALVGMSSWLLLSATEASPLRQHILRPAQRAVGYSRTGSEQEPKIPSRNAEVIGGTESGDAFFEPTYYLARRRNRMMLDGSSSSSTSETLTGDDDERWSHLIVDASRESVHAVFQELRHRQRSVERGGTSSSWWRSLWQSQSSREGGRSSSRRTQSRDSRSNPRERESRRWPWRLLLRRTTEKSDWASLSSSSSNLSSSPGFVNVDLESNHKEFNITAGTDHDGFMQENSNSSRVVNRTDGDATTVIYTDSQRLNETNSSNVTEVDFRPIRIRAYLSEVEGAGQFLSDKQHSVLFLDVLRPAMLSFSAALRVDSVRGNLTVDQSQLIDGVTCGPGRDSGLPSALVPEYHMTEGVANADIIVYLNIGFAPSKPKSPTLSAADLVEGMASQDNVTENDGPPRSPQPLESWEQAAALRNVSGALSRPTCSGEYLAASAICSTDQFDRPTAAILHICIDEEFFNETSLRRNIITMRHELAHALGFNSISLAHFRRPDGTPITPRNENGEIPLTEVECTGPLRSRTYANLTLPSTEILQFRSVRGGVRVAEVVTPSVIRVVRNHFDCQDLPGAELESGEFLPLSTGPQTPCLGDHWERRLFKNDLMNPLVEDLAFSSGISTLDLAYFADSGWYQVDLSRAAPPSGWGRAAGCDFVEQPCVNADGQVPAKFQDSFCTHRPSLDDEGYASGIDGCTTDLTKKASCSIELYQGDLPREYQYFNFTYGSNVGGRDPLMDYCPVYTGFTNGLCSDSENEALIRIDRIERFGDRNSRCIPGLLSTRRTALCLRIACAVEDSSFHVQVDGVWKRCRYKDQMIETAVGDRVFCPDPIHVCPTFYCQRDCLGTDRICNYTQGKCVCAGNCSDGEGPESFYDPSANSSSSLPDEDSPLSDYYVPTSRMLRDERRVNLDDWQIICVSLAFILPFCLVIYWFYRKRQASLDQPDVNENDFDGHEAPAVRSSTDPNKDKMIASVVVDLRMNTPHLRDDALQDRASETDLSLTDTDGGGTYVTDLSIDFQAGGLSVDESPREYVDPLAAPSVVRRRNVHG